MTIDDRYEGDTNPLVMWLYDVDENKKEIPVKLVTDSCTVKLRVKLSDDTVHEIVGENITDEGYVEFPFASDEIDAGEYIFVVKVDNTALSHTLTYIRGVLDIKESI